MGIMNRSSFGERYFVKNKNQEHPYAFIDKTICQREHKSEGRIKALTFLFLDGIK